MPPDGIGLGGTRMAKKRNEYFRFTSSEVDEMNAFNTKSYDERLRQRRDEIVMTRKHLEKEQRVVDENKDWIDPGSYQSRVHLLEDLVEWYAKEMARIEAALVRIAQGTYGFCPACGAPIESHRLKIAPEAAFCADCQKIHEEAESDCEPTGHAAPPE
jgi:DnaK suppressor protein